MTKQFTGTTFSDTYRDDFSDSAGYHKVLFNSGRALQGRELNQLQTILQTQITRMANNLFFDGAAVSPKSSGAGCDITEYVIVEELFKDADEYVGTLFQGPAITGSNGLQFQVSYVTEASGADYPTLYGRSEHNPLFLQLNLLAKEYCSLSSKQSSIFRVTLYMPRSKQFPSRSTIPTLMLRLVLRYCRTLLQPAMTKDCTITKAQDQTCLHPEQIVIVSE
jgi:hypothetical protein